MTKQYSKAAALILGLDCHDIVGLDEDVHPCGLIAFGALNDEARWNQNGQAKGSMHAADSPWKTASAIHQIASNLSQMGYSAGRLALRGGGGCCASG